jgi:hypothetical protein
MTFSSETPFEKKRLSNELDIILRKYGHKPKYKKIKYYSKNSPKPITGTIITSDHQLEVPNNLQEKVYNNFQGLKNLDTNTEYTDEKIKALVSLKGQIQAAKNISPKKFPEINRITNLLYNHVKQKQLLQKRSHVRYKRKFKVS